MRTTTRREWLVTALRVGWMAGTGGLLAAGLGCSRGRPGCVDPELLSTPERAARQARGYVDEATERGEDGVLRSCAECHFFRGDTASPGCGDCQILGGPVSATGVCDAWSERGAA